MGKEKPMPNDQRATVQNPTSAEHKEAMDNRSNQLNQNNPAYHSSRAGNQKK